MIIKFLQDGAIIIYVTSTYHYIISIIYDFYLYVYIKILSTKYFIL